jgi:hypothetical protein
MICYIPGAFAMALTILDWDICMMTMLDLLAQPQFYSVAPYKFGYRFVEG